MELEMPGLSRESVEVTVENDEVTVVGRRPEPTPVAEGDTTPAATVLLRERAEGDYRRTFVLGDRLDATAISATMANGILTVIIPKGERAKPRAIEVR
jgi:HSP20 family protein